jgi:hypothetical protein
MVKKNELARCDLSVARLRPAMHARNFFGEWQQRWENGPGREILTGAARDMGTVSTAIPRWTRWTQSMMELPEASLTSGARRLHRASTTEVVPIAEGIYTRIVSGNDKCVCYIRVDEGEVMQEY